MVSAYAGANVADCVTFEETVTTAGLLGPE
jgi:hypothetical protein